MVQKDFKVKQLLTKLWLSLYNQSYTSHNVDVILYFLYAYK
jgi:hypothetical protein